MIPRHIPILWVAFSYSCDGTSRNDSSTVGLEWSLHSSARNPGSATIGRDIAGDHLGCESGCMVLHVLLLGPCSLLLLLLPRHLLFLRVIRTRLGNRGRARGKHWSSRWGRGEALHNIM